MYLWKTLLFLIFVICTRAQDAGSGDSEENFNSIESTEEHNVKVSENRFAAQLFAVLEHYKQEDPVGLPGAQIPDPISVPDITKSFTMATIFMKEMQIHNLSKFRIANIKADLKAMKVDAGIQLDQLVVRGKYTLKGFFANANGPFTIVLNRVYTRGIANLEVNAEGHLVSESMQMDIKFGNMAVDFQNLGFVGSTFQSFINSAPNLLFDALKPSIMLEMQTRLREEIDKNVQKLMGERLLPNSITPLDMAIAEGRKLIRANGLDPYHLPNYNHTVGVFSVQLTNSWITGISNFYRVGDIIVAMQNNTVELQLQVGTQEITGSAEWEMGFGLMSRVGHMQFTVQHIRVLGTVSQAMDTRKKPQISDLQIDLGNIQIRSDGAGTLDYLLELGVNVLPNLLRYQIMDALENPIKVRLQEKLNTIDVEAAIRNNVDKFANLDKGFAFDFKLN